MGIPVPCDRCVLALAKAHEQLYLNKGGTANHKSDVWEYTETTISVDWANGGNLKWIRHLYRGVAAE